MKMETEKDEIKDLKDEIEYKKKELKNREDILEKIPKTRKATEEYFDDLLEEVNIKIAKGCKILPNRANFEFELSEEWYDLNKKRLDKLKENHEKALAEQIGKINAQETTCKQDAKKLTTEIKGLKEKLSKLETKKSSDYIG